MTPKTMLLLYLPVGLVLLVIGVVFSMSGIRHVGANTTRTLFYWSFSTVYPVVRPYLLATNTLEILLPWLLIGAFLIVVSISVIFAVTMKVYREL
ncbi:MAG: hypothetical protein M1507_01800 [Candidatus Thermoplasmatota archaeon]|nr:hypothetical protein [Candidatus Thermoplasmatota archaeon]